VSDSAEGCCWVDSDGDDRLHRVCGDAALFGVVVEYPVEIGTETGTVQLCMRHALMASEEGIAKR
jgi:hypothetical protein